MSRPLLADAFDHHIWATNRVFEACAALTPEQLSTTVPGTFGTILDTLRHIVGAECSYLFVLTGGEVDPIDEETMSLEEVRAIFQRVTASWAGVLARDLDPDEVIVRRRDDGSESHAPVGIRIAQVLHHGTDHRSQIATALTQLGITPPEMDAWDLAWSQGRLIEVAAPEPTATG
jgi:uncharacterized damage-inducible protein DinB